MVKSSIVLKMYDSVKYSHLLKIVFEKCVESVKPKSLLSPNKIELVSPNSIRVGDEFIDIKDRNCHLIGFGKAVLGMAVQIERILGDKLVSGILSVPVGTAEKFATDQDMQLDKHSVIKVYEGAKNNLPDKKAEQTATRIFDCAKQLTEKDVLFVLVSGGGSALLPIPVPPITLNEKIDLIKMLASRGASINELNTLRIKISSSKGGKLAFAARNAHKVVTLILSDICGDPLHLIASGPTIVQKIEAEIAQKILKKYDLLSSAPESVLECLTASDRCDSVNSIKNSSVHIVGNNSVAIDVAVEEMNGNQVRGISMSKRIEGDVAVISTIYCKIAKGIYELVSGQINPESFETFIDSLEETLNLEEGFCCQLMNMVLDKTNRNPICLISGGETTVTIKGNGIGGRNQELALRIASEIKRNPTISKIIFLAAGTDGIDGPCDAAGAIASSQLADDCIEAKLGTIETYIHNNDSYSLLKRLCDGKYHIVTGHTGTNVMDLHFLFIPLIAL